MQKYLKLTLLTLAMLATLALAGCGGGQNNQNDQDANTETESITEQREAATNEAEDTEVENIINNESNKTALEELAALEKDWQQQLMTIVVNNDEVIEQWQSEELTYNQQILALSKVRDEFDQFYTDCQSTFEEKDFANKLEDETQYKESLAYGQQLRDTVKEFYDTTFEGGQDEAGNTIDISGENFEEFYKQKMITEFNDNYRKLNAALKNF